MMEINPWEVESIQAFYFLKCPECAFDTKEENYFQDHAVENHPLSSVLFNGKSQVSLSFSSVKTSFTLKDFQIVQSIF